MDLWPVSHRVSLKNETSDICTCLGKTCSTEDPLTAPGLRTCTFISSDRVPREVFIRTCTRTAHVPFAVRLGLLMIPDLKIVCCETEDKRGDIQSRKNH